MCYGMGWGQLSEHWVPGPRAVGKVRNLQK